MILNYIKVLELSPLLLGLNSGEISALLENVHYQVKQYAPGEIIAFGGDECKSLQIILKGSVKGEMMDISGKVLKIEDITEARPLAVAFLFGQNNHYPVTVTANQDVTMLSISRESVVKLLQCSEVFLINYMNAVSNRAQFISGRLRFLSFQSLKGKLAHYILELDREKNGNIVLPKTQEEMSELFGVARPSLSRALRELHHDGIIEAEGKQVKIINRNALVDCLQK